MAVIGFTTPYYFLFVALYLTNQWDWARVIPVISFHLPRLSANLWVTGGIIFMVLPFLIGSYYAQQNLNKMLIQVRKSWSLLLVLLMVCVVIILVNPGPNYLHLAAGGGIAAVGISCGGVLLSQRALVSAAAALDGVCVCDSVELRDTGESKRLLSTLSSPNFHISHIFIFPHYLWGMKFGVVVFPRLKLRPRYAGFSAERILTRK